MKSVRKETDRLRDELASLRKSRKSIDDFNSNFLINYHENCRLMHSHLNGEKPSKFLLPIASRQYFVFLVSCWETYFRDVFIYINTRNRSSLNKLLTRIKHTEKQLETQSVTLPELLSKSFNFQNLKDLEEAFDDLWGADFLEYVCTTQTEICGLNGKITQSFSISQLFEDWYEIIKLSFDTRHKVVHDANYRPKIDYKFIQKSEALLLMIPQLVTYFLAKRFNLKSFVLSNGEVLVPYIFTIRDILADDWQIEA